MWGKWLQHKKRLIVTELSYGLASGPRGLVSRVGGSERESGVFGDARLEPRYCNRQCRMDEAFRTGRVCHLIGLTPMKNAIKLHPNGFALKGVPI